MKGNTKKTGMIGFGACWARKFYSRQKPMQLPSSRSNGGKGSNSPEAKHHRRAQQRFNKTGGIPRGKAYVKMYRLGYTDSKPRRSSAGDARQTQRLNLDGIS